MGTMQNGRPKIGEECDVRNGMVDGTSLRGRPSREWLDDVKDWCNADIHTLSGMAQDQLLWSHVVKSALDTNER